MDRTLLHAQLEKAFHNDEVSQPKVMHHMNSTRNSLVGADDSIYESKFLDQLESWDVYRSTHTALIILEWGDIYEMIVIALRVDEHAMLWSLFEYPLNSTLIRFT